jgi:hypothetical protein
MTNLPLLIFLAPLIIIIFVVKNFKTTRIQKWHQASIVVIMFSLLMFKINSCPKDAGFCDMFVPAPLLLPGLIAGLILMFTSIKFLYSKMNAFNRINFIVRVIDVLGVGLAVFYAIADISTFYQ